jgi:hypothetical protein
LDRLGEIDFAAKKLGKSLFDLPYFPLAVTCAFQSHLVYSFNSVGVVHNTKRRNIASGAGKPAKHCKFAYANKLMNHAIARNKGPISDLDVAREEGAPSYDHAIADFTVMGNVVVVHELTGAVLAELTTFKLLSNLGMNSFGFFPVP